MPFIINNIDTLMTIISITIKIAKFLAKAFHIMAITVGAVLIVTGFWLYNTHQHFAGITQTYSDVAEAEHGPVLAEFGTATSVAPELFVVAAAPALLATDWVLDQDVIVPAKPAAKRRKRAVKQVA